MKPTISKLVVDNEEESRRTSEGVIAAAAELPTLPVKKEMGIRPPKAKLAPFLQISEKRDLRKNYTKPCICVVITITRMTINRSSTT
jgi:hypothetical protein